MQNVVRCGALAPFLRLYFLFLLRGFVVYRHNTPPNPCQSLAISLHIILMIMFRDLRLSPAPSPVQFGHFYSDEAGLSSGFPSPPALLENEKL